MKTHLTFPQQQQQRLQEIPALSGGDGAAVDASTHHPIQVAQNLNVLIMQSDPQTKQPSESGVSEPGPGGRRHDLSLQIPPRPYFTPSRSSKGLQSSSKSSPSPVGFLRGLSFKRKTPTIPEGEKSFLIDPDSKTVPGSPSVANVLSSLAWKRCTSLPVTPASHVSPSISTPISARMPGERHKPPKGPVAGSVSRSLSVPGRNMVIVRSVSFAANKENSNADSSGDQIIQIPPEEEDEEIPEEEALCRICLDVCQEGNTLKMECSCKGALRLLHEECAIKWFTTKGNKICDVCGQEVMNLPVTLLRNENFAQRETRQDHSQQSMTSQQISAWQDFVVLVIISTICYFFFLEQLLLHDMKSQAVILSAPFSLSFGILSSVLAIFQAMKEYIWTYAALEFALLALSMHLLYSFVHLKAVYALLLASMLGFGMAMSINSLYIQLYAWRVGRFSNSTTSPA